MATEGLRGTTASIAYTPSGESQITHQLAYPFLELEAVDPQPRHVFVSADLSTRHIVQIGEGARDLWATIRFENEPGELKDLLRAGLHDDVTLTYEADESATGIDCKLIEIEGGEVALRPDRARHGYGEWEVRIRLRGITDDWDDMLAGAP